MTAEQIFRSMRMTFAEKTGETLDPGCDLAVRMYAAAAQLETLYQYADWSRKQAFPQTADGVCLEYHGQMRNLVRRPAQHAAGSVRIILSEPQPTELVIPAGSCLLAANETEFTLDEDCVFLTGATTLIAPLTALRTGPQSNLTAGSRLVFTSGPACVQKVLAFQSLTGGADAESDEEFRARILHSFSPGGNGMNADAYRALALSVPGIAACSVIAGARGPLTLDMVAADIDGMPSQAQLSEICQLVSPRAELGIDIEVTAPDRVLLDVEIVLRPADGVSFEDAENAARQTVASYFGGKLLGTSVYASALSHRIFATGLVKDCTVDLDGRGDHIDADELPILESVRVTEAAG